MRCRICGRECLPTRNDADGVWLMDDGGLICGKCSLDMRMKAPESPCLDCPRRSAECHGTCRDYAEWQGKHLEYKRKIADERFKQKETEDYTLFGHWSKKRRK